MSTMVTHPISPPESSKTSRPQSPRTVEWLRRSDSPNEIESAPSVSRPSTGTIQGIRRIASEGHSWAKKFHFTVGEMEGKDVKGQDAKLVKHDHHSGTVSDAHITWDRDGPPHVVAERGESIRTALQGPRTERSVSRGRALVDKSIEAMVKNPETGGTARSRKASHMMGIFDPRTESQSPMLGLGDYVAEVAATEPSKPSSRPTSPVGQDVLSAQSPRRASREVRDATIPKSRDTSLPPSLRGSKAVSSFHQDHDPYFRQQDLGHGTTVSPKSLDDIRAAQKAKILDERSEDKSEDAAKVEQPTALGVAIARHPGTREDEEEHISAAVYYPHPGPSPEDIERFTSPGEVSPDLGGIPEPSQAAVEITPSTDADALDISRSTEHIDISVVSQHEKKIFHGNYQPLDEATTGLPTPALSPVEESTSTAIISTSESDFESGDEFGQRNQTDDIATTPTQRSTISRRPTEVHVPNTRAKVVLEPYKHQVGGHSTIFRFSRRAVCKQLNNRENEFYERIEQRHPDMLKFLPRYVPTELVHGTFDLPIGNVGFGLGLPKQIYWCAECYILKSAETGAELRCKTRR